MSNIKEVKKLEERLSKVEKERKESEWLEGFENTISKYEGEDEVVSFEEMRKILDNQEEKPKIKTSIPTLDRSLGGLEAGDLVVISAPTGMGKTSLGRTFTTNMGKNDEKSLWLSYEMRSRVFLDLFDDSVVGYLPKQHIAKDPVWAERKIVEAIAKYEVKSIFIDHLHYLVDMQSHQSISWRIGEVMRRLKGMAIRYGVIIFLIAHTKKTDTNQGVKISDLRDSSFISQEADFVLMLNRLEVEGQSMKDKVRSGVQYTDETNLMVKKNRRTGRLTTIRLVMRDNLFYEKSNREIADEAEF